MITPRGISVSWRDGTRCGQPAQSHRGEAARAGREEAVVARCRYVLATPDVTRQSNGEVSRGNKVGLPSGHGLAVLVSRLGRGGDHTEQHRSRVRRSG